jgi:hypothetical protein
LVPNHQYEYNSTNTKKYSKQCQLRTSWFEQNISSPVFIQEITQALQTNNLVCKDPNDPGYRLFCEHFNWSCVNPDYQARCKFKRWIRKNLKIFNKK